MPDAPTSLDPAVRAALDETLEHFNAGHADTVLLLTRYAAGCPDATDAEAVDVDRDGVTIAARTPAGATSARMVFDAPVASVIDVQAQVLAKVGEARARAGTAMDETSLEHELRVTTTLPTLLATVAGTRTLTPNLRELTLEGLDDFAPLGGDQFVLMMVPGGPGTVAPGPGFTMADWRALPDHERPPAAYYTVRSFDADAGIMVIWVVVHGHDAGVGGWTERCTPGDQVALWGPRGSLAVERPTGEYLFVVDESGLAAAAALLAEIGGTRPVTVIAETVDEGHTVELPHADRADVRWLHRGDAEPGTGPALLDAVTQLNLAPATLTVFGAGESRQVTAIRKYLRNEVGLAAERVYVTGYWRRSSDRR